MRTVLAALIVLGFAATGCGYPVVGADPTESKPPPRATPTSNPAAVQPTTGTAKLISAELDQVRVIAARPKVPGYKRDQFGQTWTDDHAGPGGHNGCLPRTTVSTICSVLTHQPSAGPTRTPVFRSSDSGPGPGRMDTEQRGRR